ncbi:MAG: hypothetical protein O2970_05065 [Proteobacteria bacterium]|nr:hypothetical protein [Pseudomonadota bacterium]
MTISLTKNNQPPVFNVNGTLTFSGNDNDYLEYDNNAKLMLTEGAYVMSFNATTVAGENALFSKDASGNRDGGHLFASINDGILTIRLQGSHGEEYIKLEDDLIQAGQDYHLAITFGENGFNVYLDGKLKATEIEYKQTMELNYENIIIGANGYTRNDNDDFAKNEFTGTITDFEVYGVQLNAYDVADMSGNPAALYAFEIEEFMPAFTQFENNATDTLVALGAQFGYTANGTTTMKAIVSGTDADDVMNGTASADYLDGGMGDDTINGGDENDELQGGYGNDDLFGGNGDDLLDGGHGEDLLDGGDGNDVLISRADAREPFVTYAPLRDESDPLGELDPVTGKLYPDQPLNADDVLTGGAGADTFYFQTLINAKYRYIEEHTNHDGTVDWGNVAGENDKIHDHWVGSIGNDTITDFNRAEGDKIIIEGHTTEQLDLTYGDINNDGVYDHSIISLYSDQGNNGGAHNDDLLGTITVYGDLLREDDFTIESANYGIINNVAYIDQAVTPLELPEDRQFDDILVDAVDADYGEINGNKPVFSLPGTQEFTGDDEDYLDFQNDASLMLSEGTYILDFNAGHVTGSHALFSKDANGNRDGGHLKAFIQDGILKIRLQAEDGEKYIVVNDHPIQAGQDYNLAISFGDKGFKVYLNGEMVGNHTEFKQTMELNSENLVISATGSNRDDGRKNAKDEFDGTISDFKIYDTQLTADDVAELSGNVNAQYALQLDEFMPVFSQFDNQPSDEYEAIAAQFGYNENGTVSMKDIVEGTEGDDTFDGTTGSDYYNGGLGDDIINGGDSSDELQGGYGDDEISGGEGNDLLDGGHGQDILNGGNGDDVLVSRSDAREPFVEFDPFRDESDPLNELDPLTGKLYPDQPIPANDVLTGGAGADTFYFQTLINAKYRYIEEHTRSDGTINWKNVTNENDKIHDHWVGSIGDDTITDFNKAEGDEIIIEGHTTELFNISYVDEDSNGSIDYSLIELYSNQGSNGGAHNQDKLGTIKVYGDLVNESDITFNKTNYGIIDIVDDIDEVVAPLDMDTNPDNLVPYDGTSGNDVLIGGDTNDLMNGMMGNDVLFGGNGDDTINGGFGSDILLGTGGEDTLNGGFSNDVLVGGYHADSLTGGMGSDTFKFNSILDSHKTLGVDTIEDFQDGVDFINLSNLQSSGIDDFSDLTITNGAINTTIEANNFEIQLAGVITLDDSDFIWT